MHPTVVFVSLVLLGFAVTGQAHGSEPDDEDTMVVVDRDTLPEDIVNVIRLPLPARETGRSTAEAARSDPGPELGEATRDAATGLAEQARTSGSETAREARERAADLAESLRDAARDAREDQVDREGPPFDIELPKPAPPRP